MTGYYIVHAHILDTLTSTLDNINEMIMQLTVAVRIDYDDVDVELTGHIRIGLTEEWQIDDLQNWIKKHPCIEIDRIEEDDDGRDEY